MLNRLFSQRGLSLVETMVGLTIGLVVAAGASSMMVRQVSEHRRMTLETQVQQDLRVVADLMQKELRKAGMRLDAQNMVWTPSNAAVLDNAYSEVQIFKDDVAARSGSDGNRINYRYARKGISAATPDVADEFGFRQRKGRIEFLLGGRWQPLTDESILNITSFTVRLVEQAVPLAEICNGSCPSGLDCQVVRQVDIQLEGRAVHDAQVVRHLDLSTRIRADQNLARGLGSCL